MTNQPANSRRKGLICLVLVSLTLVAFSPTLTHDFLGYDDQQYVTENPHVQAGITWQGIVWAFKTFYASNWHPLTWLSHMVDWQLYGWKPAGPHLTNVLLHVANTLLLFLLLNRMTGALWRSAFVAALFAWHPLHAESVAWIAERKDVLCSFFFFLTIWAYSAYVTSVGCPVSSEASEVQGSRFKVQGSRFGGDVQPQGIQCSMFFWYCLALTFFALGLMSKPMAVTLPFVLLLLDFWPLGRFELNTENWKLNTSLLLEKLPFFALSAIASVLTMLAQHQAYSVVSTAGLPIPHRLAHALVAYLHYLVATFVPIHLAAYYPYETSLPAAKVILAGIVVAAITVLALRFARRQPWLWVGWLWYLGMLVPVIGLVQVGDQAWADRYTYLPLIGIFIALVWGTQDLMANPNRNLSRNLDALTPIPATRAPSARFGAWNLRFIWSLGFGAWSFSLLLSTSIQLRHWQNTRTLFEHAAAVTQNNGRAITVLGSLLAKEGKLDEAMSLYAQALRWKPHDPQAHFFLGNAFDQQDKLDEAIAEYNQALWFKPLQERTHLALGVVFAKQKKYDLAAAHYQAALAINPDSAAAQNNYARLLQTVGRLDEAIEHYSAALKMDPNLAQTHNNLGVLLLQKGRTPEGVAQLREAVRLRPADFESQSNLAMALNQQQNWNEAAEIFGRIAPGRPNDPRLYYEFGFALEHLQKTREAMSRYAHALLLQPDSPDALDRLSWILATDPDSQLRNGTEAVRIAERAVELTARKDPVKLKTLAAAYAESGRFPEAAAAAQTAQDLASSAGLKQLSEDCHLMLENFNSAKPWRERK